MFDIWHKRILSHGQERTQVSESETHVESRQIRQQPFPIFFGGAQGYPMETDLTKHPIECRVHLSDSSYKIYP